MKSKQTLHQNEIQNKGVKQEEATPNKNSNEQQYIKITYLNHLSNSKLYFYNKKHKKFISN
jgi:hypothetical protein